MLDEMLLAGELQEPSKKVGRCITVWLVLQALHVHIK